MARAHASFTAFDFAGGHAALERAIAADSDFLPARWARFQLPQSLAHGDAGSIEAFRDRWQRGLSEFGAIPWEQPKWREQVWGCVGQCTSFYRHYLGDDVTREQRKYGALVARMMAALTGPLRVPAPPARNRRRVVYISAYTYEHTVTRLFGPLITQLDPGRFEVHLLQLDPATDAHTGALASGVAQVHKGPRGARDWCGLIMSLAPDAIVYSDVGMHPLTQGLAALRLAPLQAVLWGHPVTTGLPSLDFFLSSEWFEPIGAEQQYTEQLLCLPGLGAGLVPRDTVPRQPRSWPAPGARAHVELLCAQSVFKQLPDQVAAMVSILAAAPEARLHLTPHADAGVRSGWGEHLRSLLHAAGGDPDSQLILHPLLPLDEYRGLAARCDLGLDTTGWSGGMSALDQLCDGLPVLSVPGNSMRSRQTAALLQHLDVRELIATDLDDYCRRALALIGDAPARDGLRRRLIANRERLYNTAPVHRAFADFLARAA